MDRLPLCSVLENEVMVVHGGISTADNVMLSDINAIRRGREPPEGGLMSELLWSGMAYYYLSHLYATFCYVLYIHCTIDPQPELGRSPSKRGVGFSFGPDITRAFLERNNLSLLVRSHEVCDSIID